MKRLRNRHKDRQSYFVGRTSSNEVLSTNDEAQNTERGEMNLRQMTKNVLITIALLFAFPFLLFSAEEVKPSNKLNLPPEIAAIKIPEENGRITEYHAGSKPFNIFYIQDAHVNVEAQKGIAKIIEKLIEQKGIRLVLVEGGIGDVSLTEYRVGPKEKRVEIAEQLLKEGKISGEEYLNFVEDYPLLLWGIESQVLYDENLIAFTKVEPLMAKTGEQLTQVEQAIQSLKSALYPKEYYDYETRLGEFSAKNDLANQAKLLLQTAKTKEIAVSDYPNIEVLSKLIQLEGGADFERVDYERGQLVREMQRRVPAEALKKVLAIEKTIAKDALKRADFYEALIKLATEQGLDVKKYSSLQAAIPYLREQDKIDSLAFFNEKDKLEDKIAFVFLQTEDAKKLYQMSKDVKLLETLIKLELVPEHYATFTQDRERFKVAGWAPFLTDQSKKTGTPRAASLPKDLPKLDETIDSFQSFYRIANIRDQALVENLTEKIRDEKSADSILIAGGFHKDRLIRKLLRIGFNVTVISPSVGINQGPELYRRVLKEKWENGRWYIKGENNPPQ